MSSSKKSKSNLSVQPLFNLQNATPTFKNLLFKYEKQNATKIKNTKRINANSILIEIDKRRHKVELEENSGSYMHKELLKNLKVKEDLVNNYGLRAYKHYNEASKHKYDIKLDKVEFLNPIEIIKKNSYSLNRKLQRQNMNLSCGRNKLLKLPEINNTESTEKKRTKMINEIKRLNNYSLDYGINNHTGVLDKGKSNKTSNDIKVPENNDSSYEIQNYTNGIRSQNYSSEKINKSKILTINNFNRSHLINKPQGPHKMNKDYLKYLQTFRDKLVLEEKKHKNYFDSNNYGCDSFRQKYNYLNTRFFQTNQED